MKKIINEKKQYVIKNGKFPSEIIEFIREKLKEIGVENKIVMKMELLAEETISDFISHSTHDTVYVKIQRFFGDIKMYISMKGEEFSPFVDEDDITLDTESDEYNEANIKSILYKSYGENFKYKNKNNTNTVKIKTPAVQNSFLYRTLIALALGLIMGVLFKLVIPHPIADGIKTYALTPFRTLFMNALKIIIAPVIFFSLACCISQFKNVGDLGRIGIRVISMYLLTTLIAVGDALLFNKIFTPGKVGFALNSALKVENVDVGDVSYPSFLESIISIVPSNFLQPFVESNTLQVLFLGIICGIAVKSIGEYSEILTDFFEACNSLFLTITVAISKFIPLAVFCSISLMVYELGGSALKDVLSYIITTILALTAMFIVYGVLVLLLTGLNPITFYKKIKDGMITSFTLSSSSAAMPTNMRICTEKLGISPKLSNFSIPLGATINMDGFTVCLTITTLFLARAYDVSIPQSALLSLLITVVLLSLGTPGVPGSAAVALCVLLKVVNVPFEATGIFLAVYPILEMVGTMSNTTGDMAATLITAKKEKLIDLEKFNE